MDPWNREGFHAETVDPLVALMNIERIRLLKARYLQAVDEKNYGVIREVFTADAIVDFSGEPQHHVGHHGVSDEVLSGPPWVAIGGQAAADVIAGAVGDIITVHHGHDPRIYVSSADRAVGLWSLYDRLEYPQETMHGYGQYHESYVVEDGVWRIATLKLTRLRVVWSPNSSVTN